MADAQHALTGRQKVTGQGHMVIKTNMVAWLIVKCAAAAGMGLHVV